MLNRLSLFILMKDVI